MFVCLFIYFNFRFRKIEIHSLKEKKNVLWCLFKVHSQIMILVQFMSVWDGIIILYFYYSFFLPPFLTVIHLQTKKSSADACLVLFFSQVYMQRMILK